MAAVLLAYVGACDRRPAEPQSPKPGPTTMSDIGSMYFSRVARIDRMGGKIVAIDPNAPRMITMDPWPELVFQMADGQHTVAQLREHLASQYEKGAPPGLDEQVNSIVRHLEQDRLIRLHSEPVTLPFYLSKPVSEQNPEDARKAMERDGVGGRRGT
jgi:hypothetical protein